MKVNHILTIIDLTNINIFKVNGMPIPFTVLKQTYADFECSRLEIKTRVSDMIVDDIKYDIIVDNTEVEAFVQMQLPNTPTYINIELNFTLKGGVDNE